MRYLDICKDEQCVDLELIGNEHNQGQGTVNKHMKKDSFQLITRRHNSTERFIFHKFIGKIMMTVLSGSGEWRRHHGALLMGCQSRGTMPVFTRKHFIVVC